MKLFNKLLNLLIVALSINYIPMLVLEKEQMEMHFM